MSNSSAKPKIIVVAYPLGRVGSSAMMGLLRLAGATAGKEDNLSGPAMMNPKGFFELKAQHTFLREVYPDVYPGVDVPPELAIYEAGEAHWQAYEALLLREIGKFPLAVKSQRLLTLPFLHRMRDRYDIRLLHTTRNKADQINSVQRVWQRSGNPDRANASRDEIQNWVEAWHDFGAEVFARYPFPTHPTPFETITSDPAGAMRSICAFLDLPVPSDRAIEAWIDPKLVNRPKFSFTHWWTLLRSRVLNRENTKAQK